MGTPDPEERTTVWPLVAVIGGFVVCCAGPILLALVATGIGAAAIRSGAILAGAAAAGILVVIGFVWWRRQACARPAAPAGPPPQALPSTGGSGATPRERLTSGH